MAAGRPPRAPEPVRESPLGGAHVGSYRDLQALVAQGEVPDPATSTSGGSLDSLPELAPAGPPAFVQRSENDAAKSVIVCEPGLPKMMGALHPAGSLYERPVNLETAKAEHRGLRAALRRFGEKVLSVREILRYGLDDNLRHRVELEDFCMGSLHYVQQERLDG